MKASLALTAAVALALAGCFGGDDEQAAEGRQPPKLVDATAVEGGGRRERVLLQRVVRGMKKTTLKRIVIGSPSAGGQAASGVTITFERVLVTSVRSQWEEWIVAGAFSRRLRAAGRRAQVVGHGREGSFTARPTVRGRSDPRPLSSREEAAVVRAIRNAATRSGGEIERLEVHRPYGVAVALSLWVEDPASFLKHRLPPLLERLEVHRRELEGMYLGLSDTRRRLVLEWGSWTRNPAGSYWVRRDLAQCSPIQQSEPRGADPPPPCPV